jgi:hypothetical protein
MAAATLANRRVAVLEDNDQRREQLCGLVKLCRGVPVPSVARAPDLSALPDYFAKERIELLVSDHRLYERGDYATYCGAQAVAESYRYGVGGIVLTAYEPNDADNSLRLSRRWIPALLHSRELTRETLRAALLMADKEVREHQVPIERIPHRTVMTVKSIESRGTSKVVKVMMIQWDTVKEVGFPLDLVPKKLQAAVKSGSMLIAEVNIEAARQEDLYFDKFELPDPDVLNKSRNLFGRP